jgi:hypothetical protein
VYASPQAKVAEELQPEKLIRALEEKGAQLEEESDELYSEFMSENIPVDAFVVRCPPMPFLLET